MALPTGTISLSDVDVYLGAPATQLISLNDTAVRTLAGVPSGTIAMSNLQGKPGNPFILNVITNQANYNVRVQALAAGWNGTDAVIVNIASGVVIYSSSTGSYAMTVDGAFPGGVTVNNSGTIVGMGGAGGGGTYGAGVPGSSGGPAIFVGAVVTFVNSGTIASGGGGGGASHGHIQTAKGPLGDTGGGGGGGQSSLAPSSGGIPIPPTIPVLRRNGAPGASGTFAARGAGGVGDGNEVDVGGPGGVWGSAGAQGSNFFGYPPGAPGGAAGTSITGYGLLNLSGSGTIYGPTSNGDETLLTISTPQTSTYNINTQATAAGWNGTRRVRVIINPGVSVVSASTGTAAMVATGAFPNALVITNNGYIVGKGGAGGSGGSGPSGAGSAGSAGGFGLSITGTTSAIYMINNGTIAGGGGGGGGAGVVRVNVGFNVNNYYGGGGGGGGAGLGAGGPGGSTTGNGGASGSGSTGSPGTALTYGAGGAGSPPSGATGGNGGAFGSNGSTGPSSYSSGGSGGSAGGAVYGDNFITYVTTGSIIGARESTVANLTVASPQVNLDLRTYALAAGWNGIATVNLTISPGVTISSASTGTPALTIAGPLPNGASLTNNGTISAAGGAGGAGSGWVNNKGASGVAGSAGTGGGTALYVTYSGVPVTNNGTIAGGGGGGGGGAGYVQPSGKTLYWVGGNGGSGGAGNVSGSGGSGGSGLDNGLNPANYGTPGNAGGSTTGGAAVGSGGAAGGAGGARGSAGLAGGGYAGGAAGAAVVGTANITWLATGTRIGPIS